ncbi:MAG TPA: OFA family MFS transporter [Candidatus Sulfotelmatobacter sp.]|nr:OFA family MFS transporter [Candidatus Sulfotelmatobacter sp.]
MTQQPASPIRGWTVLLAAVCINLILGVLYAWSVMAKALVTQWHWTKTQAALPFTVSTAAFAIMMIFAGRLQDKIGPRFVAMAGGIILGLGLIASSFVSTPLAMLLTFGLIGGVGIGLGYSATTPPAIKWFPPARKGLITGIVVSGVGLAAVYISPLTQHLLKTTSISRTFFLLGIGAIILVSLLSQILANPPAGYAPAATATPSATPSKTPISSRRDLDWPEMLRTRQFYQLWLMFVLAASAGLMIIAHVAMIAKEQAHWEWGFVPVATLAIFNTIGRVVAGFLSDRIGRSRTMILAFLLQAINMFVFVRYNTPALLVFGSAFTGLCYGTIFTLMPAATADFYGIRNLGVNYGLLFTGFGVAGVVGPILGGKVRDSFGSYSYSFTISAILLLLGTVLAFTLSQPKTEPAPALSGSTPDKKTAPERELAQK